MKRIGDIISQISPMRYMSLVGMISFVGLAGCTSEDTPEMSAGTPQTMTVIASPSSFLEVNPMTATRALPSGYVPYNELYPQTTPPNTTIGVFMTPERADAFIDFIYEGYENGVPTNKWTSTVNITEGTQYYIYGFMPKEDAQNVTITDPDGTTVNWADGAIMDLTMNTVTAADVCVIVGVEKWAPTNPGDTPPAIEASGIQLGKFAYLGGPTGSNHVYLLLKHIYSGLHFKLSLDRTYAALRTIKVTGMELQADDAFASTVNVRVTLTPNDTNTDPVVVSAPSTTGTSAATATLYPWTGGPQEFTVPTSPSFSEHIGCFAPNSCQNFTLRTTFDVYDSTGTLTRKGAVAENKVSVAAADLSAGEVYTVNLTVRPTYLYVLSDPDLDNPTIVSN